VSGGESGFTRLVRTATLLFGILAGALVYATFEPRVEAAQRRLDDDQSMLRSDDVAFAEVPRLRSERGQLAKRFAELLSENPEALFLRELSAVARRHGSRSFPLRWRAIKPAHALPAAPSSNARRCKSNCAAATATC